MGFWQSFGKPDIDKLAAKSDVNGLIKALKYRKDPRTQVFAALALAREGEKYKQAIEPLISTLKEENKSVRIAAAQALRDIGDRRAVVDLCALLEDKSDKVRAAATSAIGWIVSRHQNTEDGYAVDPLVVALHDSSDEVCALVARALGNIGDPRAVDALIPMLKHKSKDFFYDASRDSAIALGKIGDSRAVPALIAVINKDNRRWVVEVFREKIGAVALDPLTTALKDGRDEIRENAVWVLGEINDPQVLPLLINSLQDNTENVRKAASTVLDQWKTKGAVDALINTLQEQSSSWQVIQALGSIKDERVVELLIAELKHTDQEIRQSAVQALGKVVSGFAKVQERAVEPLIAVLHNDEDETVRASAVQALGNIKTNPSVKALTTVVQDQHYSVEMRVAAIRALGKIKGEQALEPLIATLQNRNDDIRESAEQTLFQQYGIKKISEYAVKRQDTRVTGLLINALKDENTWLKVAWALGNLGDFRAVGPLAKIYQEMSELYKSDEEKERYEMVRQALEQLKTQVDNVHQAIIFVALGQFDEAVPLGSVSVKPLINHWRRKGLSLDSPYLGGEVRALVGIGSAAVDDLIVVLQSNNEQTKRAIAAKILGEIGDVRAVEPLITALQDSDDEVRAYVVEALGILRNARAVEPIIAALQDISSFVRWKAVSALGRLRDARAVEPLITSLQDSATQVRSSAVQILPWFGDIRAVEPLLTALGDPDESVRAFVIDSLCELAKDSRIVKRLISILQSDDSEHVRNAAAVGLGNQGNVALKPLLAALGNHTARERPKTAGILARICAQEIVPELAGYITDSNPYVVREIAFYISKFGDMRCLPHLLDILKNGQEHSSNNLGEYDVNKAEWAISDMLKKFPANFAEEELRLIVSLQDPWVKVKENLGIATNILSDRVDLSELRQLARQELGRRG